MTRFISSSFSSHQIKIKYRFWWNFSIPSKSNNCRNGRVGEFPKTEGAEIYVSLIIIKCIYRSTCKLLNSPNPSAVVYSAKFMMKMALIFLYYSSVAAASFNSSTAVGGGTTFMDQSILLMLDKYLRSFLMIYIHSPEFPTFIRFPEKSRRAKRGLIWIYSASFILHD